MRYSIRSTPDPESAALSDTVRVSSSSTACETGAVASIPTVTGRISPMLPALSTARTATVWVPSPVTSTAPDAPGMLVQAPSSTDTSRWSTERSSVAVTCTVAGSAYHPPAWVPVTLRSDTTGATPSAVCIRMKVTEEAGNS